MDADPKTCIFAGPTLSRVPTPFGLVRYGPAALGSVYRAVEYGHRRIGIIDGYFGNVPAVWHKEIMYALAKGVEVVGASSMGAIRAAELSTLGMMGLGRIFRMFRRGYWTDDDEVAIVHATEELDFCPLSEAMANIRFTLRRLTRDGYITRGIEANLVERMKARHFSERTRDELQVQCIAALGRPASDIFMTAFEREFVDAKRRDALMLTRYLSSSPSNWPLEVRFDFPFTAHWRRQFEQEIADVPPLC